MSGQVLNNMIMKMIMILKMIRVVRSSPENMIMKINRVVTENYYENIVTGACVSQLRIWQMIDPDANVLLIS